MPPGSAVPSRKAGSRRAQVTEVLKTGVEEEFFLVDPRTGETVPYVERVMAVVRSRELVQREFASCQIETSSTPHTDMDALLREVTGLRAELAAAARGAGCELVASGCAPLENSASGAPLTLGPRYRRMAGAFGAVARGEKCCGCHVHVEVPDREEAVQVCNHLRPWLPVLHALAANSPFTGGADSGHASWRAIAFGRWPSFGIPPYFESAADYEATVGVLLRSGVILDRGMLYWLIRPSDHVPTVEIRVGDVCATAEETVLYVALVRALVATALRDIRAGVSAPRVPDEVLRAAFWRAAHDGLEGHGLEPVSGTLMPAWRLVDEMVDHVRGALSAAGDLERVTAGLARLRRVGSGAARQREAYAGRGSIHDVVTALARQTAPDLAAAVP
ncbi:glutamate--cysteine ligase [Planobispora siamensis]|uniref:carboxylate-amine ligase n=1 Tax=Planobispora siamensis TaxID=936338 RepID=UPI001952268E|nr:glutamate--cysteine ligase [Planobispora siamensis]